jgi:hypothetical protein
MRHQHADASDSVGLCVRGTRPRRYCAANKSDEIAPPHWNSFEGGALYYDGSTKRPTCRNKTALANGIRAHINGKKVEDEQPPQASNCAWRWHANQPIKCALPRYQFRRRPSSVNDRLQEISMSASGSEADGSIVAIADIPLDRVAALLNYLQISVLLRADI